MIFASGINSLHATVEHLVKVVYVTLYLQKHLQTGHAISKDYAHLFDCCYHKSDYLAHVPNGNLVFRIVV